MMSNQHNIPSFAEGDIFKSSLHGRYVQTKVKDEPIVTFGPKDLNMNIGYAAEKHLGVSEHIQNWRDRCLEIALMVDPTFDLIEGLKPIKIQEKNCISHYFLIQEKIIGWFSVLTDSTSGRLDLTFANPSTSLHPDNVLVMGKTSKKESVMAGHFGEGVKVEINRLLAEGAKVTYYTNNSVWTFCHDKKKVLEANIEKAIEICPEKHLTLIHLQNVPSKTKHGPTMNFSDFLFLQPCEKKYCSRVNSRTVKSEKLSGLEILLDLHTHGRIYVNGIFITKMRDRLSFGYNYSGICNMEKLGIGRDRNSLHTWVLTGILPDVFRDNQHDPRAIEDLSELIFNALRTVSQEEGNYNFDTIREYANNRGSIKYMADGLLNYFKKLKGDNALPTDEVTPALTREAQILGYKVVRMKETIFNWLKASELCPTIESIWKTKHNVFLRLPEYVLDEAKPSYEVSSLIPFPSKEEETFAREVRKIISDYFDDDRGSKKFAQMVRFKDFSQLQPRNTLRVIPMKLARSNKVDLFLIDITLLIQAKIHEDYRAKIPGFACVKQNGRCTCVGNIIIDDILDSMDTSLRSELDWKFRRRFLSVSDVPVSSNPVPFVREPKATSISSLPARSEPNTPLDLTGGNKRPVIEIFDLTTLSEDDEDNEEENTEHQNIQEYKRKKPDVSSSKTKGYLTGLDKSVESSAKQCISCVTSKSKVSSIFKCAELTGPPPKENRSCNGNANGEYKKLDQTTLNGLQIFIDLTDQHRNQEQLNNHPQELKALDIIINTLAVICKYPIKRCHIVVEDSDVMAFNREGDIFFNLLAMTPLHSRGPIYSLDFWYPLFCHELAHNQGWHHDVTFASNFGNLIQYHNRRFRESMAKLAPFLDNWVSFEANWDKCR